MIEPKVDLTRLEKEIETLLLRKEQQNATVFYGSSTFTMWGHDRLAHDMSPIRVVNRGFGGSTAHEAEYYYEKLVKPLKPKTLVWYEGDNDLASDYTPHEVMEITTSIFNKMREDFEGINLVVVSVKKSLSRENLWNMIDKYNFLMAEYVNKSDDMMLFDIKSVTHDEKGNAKRDIYIEDGLHFNSKGYALLATQIKSVLLTL